MAEPLPPPVGALGARTGRRRRRRLATSRCRPPFCAAAVVLPSTRRIRHQRQLRRHAADVSRRIEPPSPTNQRTELAPCSTSPRRRHRVLLIFLLRNRLTPPPLAAYKRTTRSPLPPHTNRPPQALSLFLSHVRPLVPPADLPHRRFARQTLAPPTPPRRVKPPPPPSLIGRSELLLRPFRPSPSLPPPSTTFPGCALLGNTISHRRFYLPATGEPAPRLPSPLFPLGCQTEEKKKSGIQGVDMDPDGYAEAAENLKAQGKT
ncbi:unknown protein [Oryza sativa Japonica Group]|uniref:Uncharacterized protein B1096D03.31 n=1 Tax=Oryza sativa subsp. japonica TaxID=39947 RepID=Q5VPY9_ORYSJ|nr:unknown protein [Oryza sativa Japonica Group]